MVSSSVIAQDGTAAALKHYGMEDLTGRVAQALEGAQLTQRPVSWAALAPLDQFHARDLAAPEELAAALKLEDGASVLDIGCGLGGPARYLAAQNRWRVTGIDLNPSFIGVARMLAEWTGLSDRVTFLEGNALELPFEDGCFDAAWTLQVAMNIADRARFYRGIRRVLKPGGWLANYDVVSLKQGPVTFPVPWARTRASSFLLTPEGMREALGKAGFREVSWEDKTAAALAWFKDRQLPRSRSALGLHVVMGPEFETMMANFHTNLLEGRVGLLQAIVRRD